MPPEKPDFAPLDWEKIAWEPTPYRGVFIFRLDEESDSDNPKIPKYTIMALKVDPNCSIPLHKHNREPGWTETLTFPKGGNFEIKGTNGSTEISGNHEFTIVVSANQAFGLRNENPKPLFFFSRMEPGFTGYAEIEEVKKDKN